MKSSRLSQSEVSRIESALAELEPRVVYVFGSHGTGRERPDSDLDLAILSDKALDPVQLFEISNRLADELGKEVDLVDLTCASAVMRKEVLRTGERLIVLDPRGACEFEMLALSDYARLNEERAAILSQ